MNQQQNIKQLKAGSKVYFGLCTWYEESLWDKSMFGSLQEFKRHLVAGVVRSVAKKIGIEFPLFGTTCEFSRKDLLKHDTYYFSEEIPQGGVVVQQIIPEDELFPVLKQALAAVDTESVQELRSFKRKILEGGVYVKESGADLEEMCDRSRTRYLTLNL